FNDFTIAHLSDFHYHPFFTAKPIARAVLLVNQLEPDLIVLTGDFVTVPLLHSSERSSLHIKTQAEPCSALLAGLHAKWGVVAILGNHDQDSQPDVVTECLEAQRIKVLRNDAWSVEQSGARLWVVGTDDVLLRAVDLPHALRVVPPSRWDATAQKRSHRQPKRELPCAHNSRTAKELPTRKSPRRRRLCDRGFGHFRQRPTWGGLQIADLLLPVPLNSRFCRNAAWR
ncbi:MAG: hypothetical protein DMG86_21115, partial [Acidobacteria bacterium]